MSSQTEKSDCVDTKNDNGANSYDIDENIDAKQDSEGQSVDGKAELSSSNIEPDTEKDHTVIEGDAGDGTKREDQYLHGKDLSLTMIALLTCLFLVGLDQCITATIINTVGNKFHDYADITWITSGFVLSMAVFISIWSKIAIIFGRKNVVLISVVLFEIGSLVSALATSMNMLIGGRVIAGVGAGGIQSTVYMIIAEIVPLHKRPITMSMVGVTFAISCALGPIIGGVFALKVTWRWAFYINLPIGGCGFIALFSFFNPPKVKLNFREKLKQIDYFGYFLLTAGLVIFLLALTFGANGKYRWDSAAVICCFCIGGVVVIVFCIWNFKFSKNSILPGNIILRREVLAAGLVAFGMYGSFMATLIYLVVYLQAIRGNNPLVAGLKFLGTIIPMVIMSIVSSIAISVTKHVKIFCIIGALFGPIGCGILTLLDIDSSLGRIIGFQVLFSLNAGLLIQATVFASQLAAPSNVPSATLLCTSFSTFARSLGGAIAPELASVVFSSSFTRFYIDGVKKLTNAELKKTLEGISVIGILQQPEIISDYPLDVRNFIYPKLMHAIRNVFFMSMGFTILALIASLFVSNKKMPKHHD